MTKPALDFPFWRLATGAIVAAVAAMAPIQRDLGGAGPRDGETGHSLARSNCSRGEIAL